MILSSNFLKNNFLIYNKLFYQINKWQLRVLDMNLLKFHFFQSIFQLIKSIIDLLFLKKK